MRTPVTRNAGKNAKAPGARVPVAELIEPQARAATAADTSSQVVPAPIDPRLFAIADRLEKQIGQADELVSAFRDRALTALAAAADLNVNHRGRPGALDSASRLATTVGALIRASATAAETIQRLRGGGAVQRIIVERGLILAGGDQGVGPRA